VGARRRIARAGALLLLGGGLWTGTAHAQIADTIGSCPHANDIPRYGNTAAVRAQLLCAVNFERASRGLPVLRSNPRLRRAASSHARNMVARGYFDHSSLGGYDFVDRIASVGYGNGGILWWAGENIAWGIGVRSTPAYTVMRWMHRHGHRRNMLDGRFRDVGIGVVFGTPRAGRHVGVTYAVDFGVRGARARSR
jgi:uncharacterized protein YkwD